jgi:hypothetical protein
MSNKAEFESLQDREPFLIAMARDDQRAIIATN